MVSRDEKTINIVFSRCCFFFRRTKFDRHSRRICKENLVKYKGEITSQKAIFIVFLSLKWVLWFLRRYKFYEVTKRIKINAFLRTYFLFYFN